MAIDRLIEPTAMSECQPKYTVVVLEMCPVDDGTQGGDFIYIGISGVGRDIDQAKESLKAAIEESEAGKRHMVALHRYRAYRRHSEAGSLEPREVLLATIRRMAGQEKPMPGFFEVGVEKAVEVIALGTEAFKIEHAARQKAEAKRAAQAKKRSRAAKKAWKRIKKERDAVRKQIHEHCFEFKPHSPFLCYVLDGRNGISLQAWAEKELERQQQQSLRLRERTVECFGNLDLDVFHYRHMRANQEAKMSLDEIDYEDEDYEDEINPLESWPVAEEMRDFVGLVFDAVHRHEWHPAWNSPALKDIARAVLLDYWEGTLSSLR